MNTTLKITLVSVLLLLLTLNLATPLQAQGPLILTAEQGKYPLGFHLEILEDPSGQLTIDDVTSAEFAEQFVPSQENIPNFGYTKSAIWARWQMSNHSASSVDCNACKDWLLEISDPTIDSITLYLSQPTPNRDDHILLTNQIGDLVPRASRDVDHHNLVFKLSLEPQTTYTLYLRVKNRGSTPLPLVLWSPEAFTHRDYTAQFGFGFYYGFIFIMVCYNLFLFFFLREVAYLYYVLSVATLGFYQLTVDGFANQYLWPNQIWWGDVAILIFIGLTLLNGLNFGSRFLLTKDYSPRLDKLMTGLKVGSASLVILSLFPSNYRLVAPVMAALTVLIVLIGIVAGVISWRGGYRPARYFLLAWGGVLISAAVVVLGQFQILPISFFTQYGLRISVFLLVLLLSLALADRINLLKANTERANRQLHENENRLAQFLEAMPVGVIVQETNLKLFYFNQLVRKLLHIPDRTVRLDPTSGRTLAEAIEDFPLYVARTQQKYPFECLPLVRALRGESATADDIEVHLGDKRIPLEVWSRPIFDEQGNITYAISAFRDITQRRETEAELEEYHRHLETLVAERTAELAKANEQLQQDLIKRQQTEEALQTVNAELERRVDELATLNRITQAMTTITNLQPALEFVAEAITHCFNGFSTGMSLFNEDRTERTIEVMYQIQDRDKLDLVGRVLPIANDVTYNEFIRRGKSLVIPDPQTSPLTKVSHKSIRERNLQCLMLIPLQARREIIGTISISTNLVGRKFTPEEVRLAETIAGQIAGGIEIARLFEKERRQRQLVEEQNQELDAFAHTVAHDLQNPLSNVITFTDYVVQSFPQLERDEILAILQKILKSGRKSSNIVKELLLLASVRKQDVPVGPLDMAPVIKQAEQRLTPMIQEYRGEIIFPKAWPVAQGYAPWIEEVWTNYLSNGLKYGGRPPRLELGAKPQSNGMIRFWVRDNGPGLKPETQATLFTEFTRLTEVRAQGHGLGLSIVRRIIEKLGGQVGFDSENVPGQGSAFYFTLPGR
jgi:signal transduction histidine kinase/PAS domain-containing protein